LCAPRLPVQSGSIFLSVKKPRVSCAFTIRVSVEAGHEAVLGCPNTSEVPLLMVTWRSSCSSCCLLSYRMDRNETTRLNCSERITWKYSSLSDPALRIYPVNLGDEGNYTCEIANREGNFRFSSSLTVIVPPTVALTQDKSRVAVCQASAGKPPADISWIPASNHSSEEEFHHPNGTVTRVSYFGWPNSSFPSVTCLVTHPGWLLGCSGLVVLEENENVKAAELKMKMCLYTEMTGGVMQLLIAGRHPDISCVSLCCVWKQRISFSLQLR
uniref:Ig-like domain-containing protein n=1 Tax=Cyanoderma ruficeps TaxID=181631 RepID=A0A8C3NZW1_9PASS